MERRSQAAPLIPPGLPRLLAQEDAAQVGYRLADSLLHTHIVVFMLDRQGSVVALAAEHADERLPEVVAVAVAASPKDPGAVAQIAITLGVENAVHADIMF